MSYFKIPHKYKILKEDPYFDGDINLFLNETIVFVNTYYNYYDSLQHFLFYEIITGDIVNFFFPENKINSFPYSEYFLHSGTDMEILPFEVKATTNKDSNFDVFKKHLPYLKDIIEGKDEVKNWYAWLTENSEELHKNLKRLDIVLLKLYGFGKIKDILDLFKVSYQISGRYKLLGSRDTFAGRGWDKHLK